MNEFLVQWDPTKWPWTWWSTCSGCCPTSDNPNNWTIDCSNFTQSQCNTVKDDFFEGEIWNPTTPTEWDLPQLCQRVVWWTPVKECPEWDWQSWAPDGWYDKWDQCNDWRSNTVNDIIQEDCKCLWEIFNCPAWQAVDTIWTCVQCPINHYCPAWNTWAKPCPSDTTSLAGSDSISDCEEEEKQVCGVDLWSYADCKSSCGSSWFCSKDGVCECGSICEYDFHNDDICEKECTWFCSWAMPREPWSRCRCGTQPTLTCDDVKWDSCTGDSGCYEGYCDWLGWSCTWPDVFCRTITNENDCLQNTRNTTRCSWSSSWTSWTCACGTKPSPTCPSWTDNAWSAPKTVWNVCNDGDVSTIWETWQTDWCTCGWGTKVCGVGTDNAWSVPKTAWNVCNDGDVSTRWETWQSDWCTCGWWTRLSCVNPSVDCVGSAYPSSTTPYCSWNKIVYDTISYSCVNWECSWVVETIDRSSCDDNDSCTQDSCIWRNSPGGSWAAPSCQNSWSCACVPIRTCEDIRKDFCPNVDAWEDSCEVSCQNWSKQETWTTINPAWICIWDSRTETSNCGWSRIVEWIKDCTPTCTPKTCSNFSGQCGSFDDGCNGTISCWCSWGKECRDWSCQNIIVDPPTCNSSVRCCLWDSYPSNQNCQCNPVKSCWVLQSEQCSTVRNIEDSCGNQCGNGTRDCTPTCNSSVRCCLWDSYPSNQNCQCNPVKSCWVLQSEQCSTVRNIEDSCGNQCGNGTRDCTPSCTPSKTCSNYPWQCGSNLSNWCTNSLSCWCDWWFNCVSGSCQIICDAKFNQACTSTANKCGDTTSGVYNCQWECGAIKPTDPDDCSCPTPPSNYNQVCTSSDNACWQNSSGNILCDGTCSAVSPLEPTIWTACDDEDATTENDIYKAWCVCQWTPIVVIEDKTCSDSCKTAAKWAKPQYAAWNTQTAETCEWCSRTCLEGYDEVDGTCVPHEEICSDTCSGHGPLPSNGTWINTSESTCNECEWICDTWFIEASGTCIAPETYARVMWPWSACTETCGWGTKTAEYICKNSKSEIVTNDKCTASKPVSVTEDCNTDICGVCVTWTTRLCGDHEEGVCRKWTEACINEQWSWVCDGDIWPVNEICDDKDNDCDGEIDENRVCAVCEDGEEKACGDDTWECAKWKQVCRSWQRSACEWETRAKTEVCDRYDNDCDGAVDEWLDCRTGSWWWDNYCGDGRLSLNRWEECDDGNYTDGDGCSRNCKIEWTDLVVPIIVPIVTPVETIEQRLKLALKKLRSSCRYMDVPYLDIRFRDVKREDQGEPADILRTYCIVKGYDVTDRDWFHKDAATWVAEFIKVVTKVHAMQHSIHFDEYSVYEGDLPYLDVSKKKWYAPYIGYAQQEWLLDGVWTNLWVAKILKPAAPIPKDWAVKILKNAWISEDYSYMMWFGRYLKRWDMAEIVTTAFGETFADYRYVFGNNIDTYQELLRILKWKSAEDQKIYLQEFITKLDQLDKERMWKQYLMHVDGAIEFIWRILLWDYDTTLPDYDDISSSNDMDKEYDFLREIFDLD